MLEPHELHDSVYRGVYRGVKSLFLTLNLCKLTLKEICEIVKNKILLYPISLVAQ